MSDMLVQRDPVEVKIRGQSSQSKYSIKCEIRSIYKILLIVGLHLLFQYCCCLVL